MDEEVIVGSRFSAPTNSVTVAIKMVTVAHDVPHGAERFEMGQLIPRCKEDRAEWSRQYSSVCLDATGHDAVAQNYSDTSLCMRKIRNDAREINSQNNLWLKR